MDKGLLGNNDVLVGAHRVFVQIRRDHRLTLVNVGHEDRLYE